jgi:hypothetical protein
MKRALSLAVLILALAAARPADARDVYLNDVKLDSSVLINSQTFPACEVRFDEKGDVHITAKGFKIDVKPAGDKGDKPKTSTPPAGSDPAPAPAAQALTKRYWLVSKQPKKGLAQYEVDVYLNGKFVKKVRSSDDPVILEVTKNIRPGQNQVTLVATKAMGDKRLSSSPTDTLEIVLGEGTVGGGTVSITKTVVNYVRTAQETRNFSDETRFEGR